MRVIGLLFACVALTSVCAQQTFRIVDNGGLTTLLFNISGTIVDKPQLNVTLGEKITFRIENYLQTSDNRVVPFGLSTSALSLPSDFSSAGMGSLSPSNSCILSTDVPNSWYVNQTTAEPCILTWIVVAPADGTYFWYTSRNQVYSGVIQVNGITTGTPSTTPAPGSNATSAPTTTSPPSTTPAPSSTAGGKNGAAFVVPGAFALICAAINALFV